MCLCNEISQNVFAFILKEQLPFKAQAFTRYLNSFTRYLNSSCSFSKLSTRPTLFKTDLTINCILLISLSLICKEGKLLL